MKLRSLGRFGRQSPQQEQEQEQEQEQQQLNKNNKFLIQ